MTQEYQKDQESQKLASQPNDRSVQDARTNAPSHKNDQGKPVDNKDMLKKPASPEDKVHHDGQESPRK